MGLFGREDPFALLDAYGERFDKPIHQPERGPATPMASIPARERVAVATWIVREDIDASGSVRTRINAGDPIPFGLESLPRVPA